MALPMTIVYAFMAVIFQDSDEYADAAISSMNMVMKEK